MTAVALAAFLLSGLAQTPPAQNPPAVDVQNPQAPCPVSADPEFGFRDAKPVRIGGGAGYVAARSRRYLEALRGSEGQTIAFARRGSTRVPGEIRPIDIWQVTWEGRAEAVTLYLDAYHYAEPLAPAGFTCVGFRLGPPPVDVFMAAELQVRLAVTRGAAREVDAIPLEPNADAPRAVMLDRFRVVAARARAAAAAGTPMDVEDLPRGIEATGTVVVATPMPCPDGSAVPPVAVDVLMRRTQPVTRGDPVSGEALAALVPGYTPPDAAIGVVVERPALAPVDVVRVTYASAFCGGETNQMMFPALAMSPARALDLPPPQFPDGVEPTEDPVWLQVVVDVDGTFQEARYIGGPERLLDAALAAIRDWRAQPARVNGVAVVSDTLLVVKFRQ